tara:strand:+ start:602 stop:1192 length:591 start_codon:yes stop_codon:yes gene_type:complete
MRIFVSVLVLIFSLQSWTKAEAIKDLSIENFYIGETLLNYFSKEEIKKNTDKNIYKDTDKKFQAFFSDYPIKLKTFDMYEYLRITYLNDDKFIIHAISGMRDFEKDNMNSCYGLQDKIEIDFDNQFSNFEKKKITFPSRIDSTGKSKITAVYYYTEDGYAEIACYDFAEHIDIQSGIDVSITSNLLGDWLNSLAKN